LAGTTFWPFPFACLAFLLLALLTFEAALALFCPT
jgi:hypothetical protein